MCFGRSHKRLGFAVLLLRNELPEVLQGFREDTAFRRGREVMLAFPCLESPLSVQVFEDAVNLFRTAKRPGITIRLSTDCLIAATAIRHGVTVVHRDRDYANLARVSGLKHRPLQDLKGSDHGKMFPATLLAGIWVTLRLYCPGLLAWQP